MPLPAAPTSRWTAVHRWGLPCGIHRAIACHYDKAWRGCRGCSLRWVGLPPRRCTGARLHPGEASRAVLVSRADRRLDAGKRRRVGSARAPPGEHRRAGLSGEQQFEERAALPAIQLRRDRGDLTPRRRPDALDNAPPVAVARANGPHAVPNARSAAESRVPRAVHVRASKAPAAAPSGDAVRAAADERADARALAPLRFGVR